MSHSLIVKSREQERSQLPFWFHCNLLTHWLCASIGHERSVVRGSHRRIYTISSQGVQSCWIGRIALLSRLPEAINAPCGCHAAALTSVPSPAHHHVSSQQKGRRCTLQNSLLLASGKVPDLDITIIGCCAELGVAWIERNLQAKLSTLSAGAVLPRGWACKQLRCALCEG